MNKIDITFQQKLLAEFKEIENLPRGILNKISEAERILRHELENNKEKDKIKKTDNTIRITKILADLAKLVYQFVTET